MAEHTPGPWEVVEIKAPNPRAPSQWNVWAEAVDDEDGTLCHDIYSGADARLIGAAPEMLAVLEELTQFAMMPWLEAKVRGVIAKAKGEES